MIMIYPKPPKFQPTLKTIPEHPPQVFNPFLTFETIAEIKERYRSLCLKLVIYRSFLNPYQLFRDCIMRVREELKELTLEVPPDEPHRPLRRSRRLAKMARVDYSRFF